ncbi:insulinase family protein, partial [Patescibacteria group bacterium]|nr:insulinase family protein [Patescibacteria group bacterium]
FKGTKKWPKPTDMNRVIESVGGVVNAFTSREYTGFWVKLPKKYLKLGLEFLYQAVFESLLPEAELEKERGVILEEIKMYEDNPMAQVFREYISQVYSLTCLGQTVLGPAKNIKSMKRSDFFNHLKKWYVPDNMVLGVAGGVDSDEVGKLAREIFSKSGSGEISFENRPEKIKISQDKPAVQLIKKPIQQAHFCFGVRALKRTHKDRYALTLLNTVLGANMSSRLFEEVREKRGLVYYVRSFANEYFDVGDLVAQAGCDANRVDEAIKVVKGEFLKLAGEKTKVSNDELKRAKEYVKGMLALSLEDSKTVAGVFSESLLLEGKIRSINEVIKRVEKVTVDDVFSVAKKVMNELQINLTVLGKFKDETRFEKLIV